jgi:CDP-diacylglycerol--serine O-phosphatidyltransferase
MKKHIPNLFTLLNLFLGCLAVLYILQPGLSLTVSVEGDNLVVLPEKMVLASWCIFAAAAVDFLDGFVARWMKLPSELGKQLDSLADLVSFGVAPGFIILQFLRFCFSQEAGGLDISTLWLLPALLIPCAGAYRLARFNLDKSQQFGFKGIPKPAVGIFISSLPLAYWYAKDEWVVNLLMNKWCWYALILVVCYGMISSLPMLALKFNGLNLKKAIPFLIILTVSVVIALIFGWLSISVGFFTYVILSLLFNKQTQQS